MIRSYHEWWESLPPDIKGKNNQNDNLPRLNQVNYIWITNLMDNWPDELNPTVDELFDWVKTGQINALADN
ncbi:MAG: hypothetical protein ACE5RN_02095 [Nitrosopumilaceae archaeon]